MSAILRRIVLATVLLGVVGGVSACAVYDDRGYGHGWNDRDHHDRDHDHDRRW